MKMRMICIASLAAWSACVLGESEPADLDVASTEQALHTCTATCDLPTWNGVPVSCTGTIYCVSGTSGVFCDSSTGTVSVLCSTCGNAICDGNETDASCEFDCVCAELCHFDPGSSPGASVDSGARAAWLQHRELWQATAQAWSWSPNGPAARAGAQGNSAGCGCPAMGDCASEPDALR